MNVLMIQPGAQPRQTEIGEGLSAMQAAVGGPIQAIYPFPEPVALICHEEGKLLGLPLNRALRIRTERSTTSLPVPSSSAVPHQTVTPSPV